MKTLDPVFVAAIASGGGTPTIQVIIATSKTTTIARTPLYYKLDNLEARIVLPYEHFQTFVAFKIRRGLIINGTSYTVDSPWYLPRGGHRSWRRVEYIGHVFRNNLKIAVDADTTVENVISETIALTNNANDPFTNTVSFPSDYTEWWRGLQFYPDGKQLLLNRIDHLAGVLKQKYLVHICALDNNVLKFIGSNYNFEEDITYFQIPESQILEYSKSFVQQSRFYIYRDELNTIHTIGSDTNSLHNLGFIPASASPVFDANGGFYSDVVTIAMPNLALEEGDHVFVDATTTIPNGLLGGPSHIVEIFDVNKTPSWRQEISHIDWLTNTDGGAMPSTIERVAAYTPLVTVNFDKILDSTVNNLQALAERVDEHTHPGSLLYFLYSTASDITNYKAMQTSHSTGAEQDVSATITSTDQVIEEWATPSGEPGVDFFPASFYHTHIHAEQTAGTKTVTIKALVYKRTSGGTETLLGTTNPSANLTASDTPYELSVFVDFVDLDTTDRIVVKIVGNASGLGTDPQIQLHIEGTTYARIELPGASGGGSSSSATRELMTADRTYYVRTDGSDSNDGLADSAGGAFLTLQKAVDTVLTLDLSIYNVTIQIKDGTYTGGVNILAPWVGAGKVTIQGNSGTPGNVIISTTNDDCFYTDSANVTIKDMELRTTTSGDCLLALGNGIIYYTNIRFGACAGDHINAGSGAYIECTGNYSIVGSAPCHWRGANGGGIRAQSKTITLTGTPAFSDAFAIASLCGNITIDGNTYSGSATGTRYKAILNGAIYSATTLPGNAAGTTSTGGQYL